MFDLENTKTLPYFLYIWAKLEVGSKMGYLLTNGRDADQQTESCMGYGEWGPGPRAFPSSVSFIVSGRPGMTKRYGNLRP